MTLRFSSLFAGIGGFDLGFHRAGMASVAQVEIDPHCRTVLARHFPDARRHDDVTTADADTIGAVDLLCGGFPCQDLSVAGRRAGLAGKRSGLFYEFMRLVADRAPRWVVIENVPGLLSSRGGRDMGAVLGTLGELGYGWAYRVLDAQYFGLAQRRERVFIVGCLGDAARAASVLFEPESGGGDPPPRRETGQGTARGAAYSVAVRGRTDGQEWELGVPEIGNALRAGDGGSSRGNWAVVPDVAGTLGINLSKHATSMEGIGTSIPTLAACLTRREGKGPDSDATTTLIPQIAHSLRAEGFDASEDGTGRGTPLIPIAFSSKDSGHDATTDLAPTMRSMNFDRSHINGGGQLAVAVPIQDAREVEKHQNGVGIGQDGDPMFTLDTASQHGVQQGMAVRRLTPTECARLQGFPDDWLDGHSDSAKYRMLGNAVAVPVAQWIGERIARLA